MVEGLSPWSEHVFRLQACTAQGCGKGPMVSKSVLVKPMLCLKLKNSSCFLLCMSLQCMFYSPKRITVISFLLLIVHCAVVCVYKLLPLGI